MIVSVRLLQEINPVPRPPSSESCSNSKRAHVKGHEKASKKENVGDGDEPEILGPTLRIPTVPGLLLRSPSISGPNPDQFPPDFQNQCVVFAKFGLAKVGTVMSDEIWCLTAGPVKVSFRKELREFLQEGQCPINRRFFSHCTSPLAVITVVRLLDSSRSPLQWR